MDKEEFPYVVASLWYPDEPVTWENLCIYTYGSQVQFGNMEEAMGFKGYVERNSGNGSPENPHKIYKLSFEEVNVIAI